jgi:hypothetical protein
MPVRLFFWGGFIAANGDFERDLDDVADGEASDGWYGARVGGSKRNAVNLILRLFLYQILHTMSS